MGEQITNAEWEKISPDNFETASLLRAVDAIDDLRGDFNDGEYSAPPQIRTDLLRLHEIAMAVIHVAGFQHCSSWRVTWTNKYPIW